MPLPTKVLETAVACDCAPGHRCDPCRWNDEEGAIVDRRERHARERVRLHGLVQEWAREAYDATGVKELVPCPDLERIIRSAEQTIRFARRLQEQEVMSG